jgi:hypothetical protein
MPQKVARLLGKTSSSRFVTASRTSVSQQDLVRPDCFCVPICHRSIDQYLWAENARYVPVVMVQETVRLSLNWKDDVSIHSECQTPLPMSLTFESCVHPHQGGRSSSLLCTFIMIIELRIGLLIALLPKRAIKKQGHEGPCVVKIELERPRRTAWLSIQLKSPECFLT